MDRIEEAGKKLRRENPVGLTPVDELRRRSTKAKITRIATSATALLLISAGVVVGVRDNSTSEINQIASPDTTAKRNNLMPGFQWIADSVDRIAAQNGESDPKIRMAILMSREDAEKIIGQPFPPELQNVFYHLVQASGDFTVTQPDGTSKQESYWTGVYIPMRNDSTPEPVVVSWRDQPLDFSGVSADAIVDPSTFPENPNADYKG
jgi:hypothetical protein